MVRKIKHFGDIQNLSGAELPTVDIITGGSPCQDLSVAGKRAGLDGERSGLFMEQIRIVKEMREHDRQQLLSRGADVSHGLRPRYMVWENVYGALSSGKPKGADFQIVLTEIVKIVKADANNVPLPKDGRWAKAGVLYGVGDDGQPFSVAWRLHDAQYWGVPQRRKRLALLADFKDSPLGKFCLTLNIGEKPRVPNPTHLSEILETDADPKYNLSPKACRGILARAVKRGKALPPILREALENQISNGPNESSSETSNDEESG